MKMIGSLQTQTGRCVKRFHSDNGTEFVNKELQFYFQRLGINFTTSSPGKSEHNGLAERVNRSLQSMTRTFMVQSGATMLLWAEAMQWAAHVLNYTPRGSTNWIAPFTKLFNRILHWKHFHTWGCNAFVLLADSKQSKFQARAWRGVFVGYDFGTGGSRIWKPNTNIIYKTKDVDFIETECTHMNIKNKQLSINVPLSNPYSLSTPPSSLSSLNPYQVLGESNNGGDNCSNDAREVIPNQINSTGTDVIISNPPTLAVDLVPALSFGDVPFLLLTKFLTVNQLMFLPHLKN